VGSYDLPFPTGSLPKLELRSKPVDFPDPLAELLIFGLLAETGQHQADRVRAIIGDTRHDQRVECFPPGRSLPGGHMRCFPQFPCPCVCRRMISRPASHYRPPALPGAGAVSASLPACANVMRADDENRTRLRFSGLVLPSAQGAEGRAQLF